MPYPRVLLPLVLLLIPADLRRADERDLRDQYGTKSLQAAKHLHQAFQADPKRQNEAPARGILDEHPSQFVKERVGELKTAIPEPSHGRITMGVAVVEDGNGSRSVLISTSERRGYLRRGVTLKPGETMVAGTGHAESNMIKYAKANNLKVIDIGATRPVCPECQDIIKPTGAHISTKPKK